MATPGNVDVASVRTAMNEVDAYEFPDDVIDQKIGEAEAIIEHATTIAEVDQTLYDMAVREVAFYRTFTSAPAEMRQGALDLNVTYDAQTFVNRLKDRRDEALARIGVGVRGTSAAIADHTDGVFPDTEG